MPHFQDIIAEHDRLTSAEIARLAQHLRAAALAHHEHEQALGHADPFWADWYAQWIVDHEEIDAIARQLNIASKPWVNLP